MEEFSYNLESQCTHEKIFDEVLLLSDPPKRKWKCKFCNEIGFDDFYLSKAFIPKDTILPNINKLLGDEN